MFFYKKDREFVMWRNIEWQEKFSHRFLLAFGFLYYFFRKIFELNSQNVTMCLKLLFVFNPLPHLKSANFSCCRIFNISIQNKSSFKGGPISETFSIWHKSLKKRVPNHSPEHLIFRWIVLRGMIWYFFLRFEPKWKTFWD